jgi:hypothetical protein
MSRRDVLMRALEATPRDLQRIIRGVRAEQAERVTPDGWSMMSVVAHLRETEADYILRWQRAIKGEGTRTQPVPHVMLSGLVVGFIAQRERTLAFLGGLEQREWGIVVDEGGRLRDDVQALVAHDNEHLNQLLELREMAETTA